MALRPISPKKLAARGGKVPASTLHATGRERFEGLRDEDFRAWIRHRPCLLHGEGCCYARDREGRFSDPAHVRTKATGAGDAGNIVPLCRRHHEEQHRYGIRSFESLHGIRLRDVAGTLWLAYEQERGVSL